MSTLKVNNIQNTSGGSSSTPEEIKKGTCKAWCNWNGTSTVSIRQSYNVSSLVDDATGRYTINFSNALPVEDFSCFVTHCYGSNDKGGGSDADHINGIGTVRRSDGNTRTTKLEVVMGHNFGNSTQDGAQDMIGVFC